MEWCEIFFCLKVGYKFLLQNLYYMFSKTEKFSEICDKKMNRKYKIIQYEVCYPKFVSIAIEILQNLQPISRIEINIPC